MGAFDDLVPKSSGSATAIAPAPSVQPQGAGAFKDLIPVQNRPLLSRYRKILSAPALPGRLMELGEKTARGAANSGKFSLSAEDVIKTLSPELDAASEILPAVPSIIPFDVITNMMAQATETGLDPKKLIKSGVEALPFGKTVRAIKNKESILDQESLTEPLNLRRPSEIIINAIKAIKPDFEAPEGIVPQIALDLAGSIAPGAAAYGLERGLKTIATASREADAMRALKALKTNPERLERVAQRGRDLQPKQLTAEGFGDNFEVYPPEEGFRRMKESLRQRVQTGSSGPKGPVIEVTPETVPSEPVKKISLKDRPLKTKLKKYYTKDESLTGESAQFQDAAYSHFDSNPGKAIEDYKSRVKSIFGSERIVSGDEAKYIVPGVEPKTMAAAHEPASALAKTYTDILLKDKSTKDLPVVLMAGGSGAGKTRSLRTLQEEGSALEKFAAFIDTNTNNVASGTKSILKIKKTGRPVQVVYVERDPVQAFESVIDRGLESGRPVPIDIHVKNQGARKAIVQLAKKYEKDPEVTFRFYDSTPEGLKPVDIEYIKNLKYTDTGIKEAANEVIKRRIQAGQLTEEQAAPFLSKTISQKPEATQSLGGIAPGDDAGIQQAVQRLNPKELLLKQIDRANAAARQAASKSKPLIKFKMGPAEVAIENSKPALQEFKNRVEKGFSIGRALTGEKSMKTTRIKLNNELGMARIGKNFEGMSEDELRSEVRKLLAGKVKEKERKFVTSVRGAEKTEPEVKAGIAGTYEPITNKATLEVAQKIVAENPDEALRIAKAPGPASAESNAIAQVLIDKFQASGNFQQAIDIVETTAAKATSQGQAIQALSMYSKLTPAGALRYTENVFSKARNEILDKFKGVKIPDRIQKQIESLKLNPEFAEKIKYHTDKIEAALTPRQRAIETARLLKAIHQPVPVGILKKISLVQTMMQLLNPKTYIRNQLGNRGFASLENLSDVVAAGFDKAVSTVTGQRSKVLPNVRVQFRGYARGKRFAIEELKEGIDLSARSGKFDIPAPGIFKSRVGQKAEQLLNYTLRVPDRAAYTAAYRESLLNQLKAAKTRTPTDAMLEIAHQDGLYRTFQDSNSISTVFSGIKKALNAGKDFGLGDAVIKYPKTPANILARGIDYSPAGFVKTVFELAKPIIGQPFNQRAFVNSAARATVGTGLVGTGIILSELGLVTGRKKESAGIRALKKVVGLEDYQINVTGLKRFIMSGFDADEAKAQKGDTFATYDWFQPQAIGLAIGANINENRGSSKGIVGSIADALVSGTQTLAEQPLVSGLQRFFGYGDVVSGFGEIAKGIPASFTPTLFNQIKLLVDDIQRNPDNENPFKEMFNLVKMRTPLATSTLPARPDPFGKDRHYLKDYKNPAEKAFNVFLNPSITRKFATDPNAEISQELIKYGVPITQQGKKLKGVEITPDEQARIDKGTGRVSEKLLRAVTSLPAYKKANELEKQKILEGTVRTSKDLSERANVVKIAKRLVNAGREAQ